MNRKNFIKLLSSFYPAALTINNLTAGESMGEDNAAREKKKKNKQDKKSKKNKKKQQQIITDPLVNFEALWNFFNEHYAFFKLWETDWQKQYDLFKPQVNKETTPEELFDIMCNMLRPLKDGHINLNAKGAFKKKFNPEEEARFLKEFNSRELIQQLFETTEKTLKDKGFDEIKKSTQLFYYSKSKKVGYLRITEFEGMSKKKVTSSMDMIIKEFRGLEKVIIDIRDNPGGTDAICFIIANRFTDKERIGLNMKTKAGAGEDNYKKLRTLYLRPEGENQFTNRIVLLTSDASFSGADVFAMIMKELPHVVLMGDRTSGQFSNMHDKKLPNGWKVTLSHQQYFSADMICHERKGILPHIKMLNTRNDIRQGIDPLIIKALEYK